jgi:hypothetical protein
VDHEVVSCPRPFFQCHTSWSHFHGPISLTCIFEVFGLLTGAWEIHKSMATGHANVPNLAHVGKDCEGPAIHMKSCKWEGKCAPLKWTCHLNWWAVYKLEAWCCACMEGVTLHWRCLCHGPRSCPMLDGLFPWSHFMVPRSMVRFFGVFSFGVFSFEAFGPLWAALHHGPWSWTMEDGFFHGYDLMVQLPRYDFL